LKYFYFTDKKIFLHIDFNMYVRNYIKGFRQNDFGQQ